MEKKYYVQGMHCASCEILIENKIVGLPGVKAVDASTGKGEVVVEYEGSAPTLSQIEQAVGVKEYRFSSSPLPKQTTKTNWTGSILTAAVLLTLFWLFSKLGLGALVNVTSTSPLPLFFALGLLAGASSCAALVGGIVLSMSKQWGERFGASTGGFGRLEPHLLFNVGRLTSYLLGGLLLGAVGARLQFSFTITSLLTILVSLVMFVLALQMLGVRLAQKFQIALPKCITRRVAATGSFGGRYTPFVMGALTLLLPCGFTLTAESVALLTGNPYRSALMMFFFALGTMPALLAIGVASTTFSASSKWSSSFLKVAGIVLVFFSLYNINAQLNALGVTSLSDVGSPSTASTENSLPSVQNGTQIVRMNASAFGYSPNRLRVRAGIPIRWEITDTGTTGCTSVLISRALLAQPIYLSHGKTSIAQIAALSPGTYKFSCSMGMVTGVMEAVN